MKISGEELRKAVIALKNTVDVKSQNDDLTNVYLHKTGRREVTVLGTDLVVFSRIKLRTEAPFKEVAVLVPFYELAEYSSYWAEDTIDMSIKGNQLCMSTAHDDVRVPLIQEGRQNFLNYFKLDLPPPKERIPIEGLPTMINNSRTVCADRHSIHALTGIHVHTTSKALYVEASDGTRLIRSVFAMSKTGSQFDDIVNLRGGPLLSALPSKGEVWSTGRHLHYKCELGVFSVLTNQGDYPDLGEHIRNFPKRFRIIVFKDEFEQVLSKSSIVNARYVRFFGDSSGDTLKVETMSLDNTRHFEGSISARIEGTFPEIVLDTRHLQYLATLSDGKVDLRGGTELEPVHAVIQSGFGVSIYATYPYVPSSLGGRDEDQGM